MYTCQVAKSSYGQNGKNTIRISKALDISGGDVEPTCSCAKQRLSNNFYRMLDLITMCDVFVSYSQRDEGRVSPLVSALTSAGLSVFWDRKIAAGKIWRDSIGAALTEARCVVVVWSEAAIKSDWVAEEAQEGKKRKILVPVRLDSVLPPLGFRSIQVADLSHWTGNNDSKAIKELIENVRNVITDAQDARLKRVAPSVADHLIDDLKTSILDLDPGMYLQPRFIHNLTREVLFIEKPDNENNNACEVRDLLYDKWIIFSKVAGKKIEFDKYVQSRVKKLAWISFKDLQLTIKKNIVYRNKNSASTSKSVDKISFLPYSGKAELDYILEKAFYLRVMIDLDNMLEKQELDRFWSTHSKDYPNNSISHLLLVQLGTLNEIKAYKNMLVLILNKDLLNDQSLLRDILFNIIEDVVLDICVANSMKNLFSLYQSVDAKRLFSKAKAEYAESLGITPYQIDKFEHPLPYVSFASCSRQSLESNIDFDLYYRFWKDFLYDEFKPIRSSSISRLEPVSYPDIESYIFNVRRFYGQIGRYRLKKMFFAARSKYPNINLFFFAIYAKRPTNSVHRRNLARLFNRKRCRMNMFAFFPVSDLKELLLYRESVRVSLFKLN